MHHPWRPTASLRILEPKLPRNQVVLWSVLLCNFFSGRICAWTFFVFPCTSMSYSNVLHFHPNGPATKPWSHRVQVLKKTRHTCFLLDNSGETPQHLVCLQAIESLFTSSQRTPPKAHENLTGKPLDKNDQKNLGLQKTKRTQLGSGTLSGMIWDGWCVTGKLRQEAIHGASEVVDIRDLGKVIAATVTSSAASAALATETTTCRLPPALLPHRLHSDLFDFSTLGDFWWQKQTNSWLHSGQWKVGKKSLQCSKATAES